MRISAEAQRAGLRVSALGMRGRGVPAGLSVNVLQLFHMTGTWIRFDADESAMRLMWV